MNFTQQINQINLFIFYIKLKKWMHQSLEIDRTTCLL